MNEIKKLSTNIKVADWTPEQWAKQDELVRQWEEEQREHNKKQDYMLSGAPERYQGESLDTYRTDTPEQQTAEKIARAYLNEITNHNFKSLVMLGAAGVGKTHLACGILREYGGQYRTAPAIVEELRRAKSFDAKETEADLLEYYGHVSLLVIDEIGRGINATDEKYMIYQVLNARYNTRKPTVLISNHNKSDFLAYIGVAAADRLVESGEISELAGKSYRRELRGK